MKAYTDLPQSRKLAEILPLESADMRYTPFNDTHPWVWDEEVKLLEKGSVPCWSLAALLDVLPYPTLQNDWSDIWRCLIHFFDEEERTQSTIIGEDLSNPVDACVKMIIKLHEQKLL